MGIIKGSNSKKFINPITGEKENFKFNIVRRSDLIGEYVGHTAVKTQKVINDSYRVGQAGAYCRHRDCKQKLLKIN